MRTLRLLIWQIAAEHMSFLDPFYSTKLAGIMFVEYESWFREICQMSYIFTSCPTFHQVHMIRDHRCECECTQNTPFQLKKHISPGQLTIGCHKYPLGLKLFDFASPIILGDTNLVINMPVDVLSLTCAGPSLGTPLNVSLILFRRPQSCIF